MLVKSFNYHYIFMAPNQHVTLTSDQDDIYHTLTALRSINRLINLPGWDDVAKDRNLQGLDSLAHQLLDVNWQYIVAGIPKSTTVEIERSQSSHPPEIDMVQIPAGRFLMGSFAGEAGRQDDEGPQHQVNLQSFLMSRTPITQAQWRAVAQMEPPRGQTWPDELNPDPVAGLSEQFRGDDKPVVNVDWHNAMNFCNRLSQLTGRKYTLPSEAQWEYACRAGTTTPFAFGETLSSELANYDASVTYCNGTKGEYREQTTPVGMFPANAWGLQDMHGNVWEWCLDHWHASYKGAPEDGSAWLEEKALQEPPRLLRGGSWFSVPHLCRSAFRLSNHPGIRSGLVGFRVCCPIQSQ
jgi:formylglycine-generating enzyme required for sulfatase activity